MPTRMPSQVPAQMPAQMHSQVAPRMPSQMPRQVPKTPPQTPRLMPPQMPQTPPQTWPLMPPQMPQTRRQMPAQMPTRVPTQPRVANRFRPCAAGAASTRRLHRGTAVPAASFAQPDKSAPRACAAEPATQMQMPVITQPRLATLPRPCAAGAASTRRSHRGTAAPAVSFAQPDKSAPRACAAEPATQRQMPVITQPRLATLPRPCAAGAAATRRAHRGTAAPAVSFAQPDKSAPRACAAEPATQMQMPVITQPRLATRLRPCAAGAASTRRSHRGTAAPAVSFAQPDKSAPRACAAEPATQRQMPVITQPRLATLPRPCAAGAAATRRAHRGTAAPAVSFAQPDKSAPRACAAEPATQMQMPVITQPRLATRLRPCAAGAASTRRSHRGTAAPAVSFAQPVKSAPRACAAEAATQVRVATPHRPCAAGVASIRRLHRGTAAPAALFAQAVKCAALERAPAQIEKAPEIFSTSGAFGWKPGGDLLWHA